ncbi:DivIVA domain-containing protein [Enterococcus sp. AZ072]|uniref:DivIVA domain-containing protein n=1 Tax=unclassified Enterococcus TaxID=2608891 RepID=UPI003D26AB81
MNFEAIELRKLTFKKNALGGFRQSDVNDFLRNVADDYETYDERIRRLIEEKEKLETKLTSKQAGQNRLTTQQETEKNDLLQKIQQLETALNQLRTQKAEWDQFKQLHLDYQDITKMKRIAQQTLEAAEKAANKLLEEAERKKTSILTTAQQQKHTLLTEAEQQQQALMNQAEEERLQNLFSSKLEISALQKEQEEWAVKLTAQQQLLEKKQHDLLQLKASIHDEIQTFAGMMTAARQEISQEYTASIEALTKKNETVRKETQARQPSTTQVLEREKEVM